MKKTITCIAVLLVLSVVGWTMFAHAAELPAQQTNAAADDGSVPEVSTDFEVSISLPTDLTTVAALKIDRTACTLRYKDTAQLTANKEEVIWTSDNDHVVTANEYGLLTAVGRGTATVTATDQDGETATCTVTVRYTLWQWIIRVFLFGWLWY